MDSVQSKLQFKAQEFIELQYASLVCRSKAVSIEISLAEAINCGVEGTDLEREKELLDKLARAILEQKKGITVKADQLSQLQCKNNKLLEDHSWMMSEKAQLEHDLQVERQAVLRLEKVVTDANAATRFTNDEALLLTKEVKKYA